MGTRKIDAKEQARLLWMQADRAEGVLAGAVGGLGEAPKTREAWHELLDETLTRIATQRDRARKMSPEVEY